jgi:hypothetical protein
MAAGVVVRRHYPVLSAMERLEGGRRKVASSARGLLGRHGLPMPATGQGSPSAEADGFRPPASQESCPVKRQGKSPSSVSSERM